MDADLRRAIIADLLEEDEIEDEVVAAAIEAAHVAIMQIMEMEDGLDAEAAPSWVKVTVDIEEYLFPDPCFALHFRMDWHTFEELCKALQAHLESRGRWQRTRTPLRHIVLMVLWILATPDSFRSVALRFGVRPSTLYYHYTTIIEALREMSPNYIKWPDQQERTSTSNTFEMASGLPGVIGAIDCTHVFITRPCDDAAEYRNRHHSYSVTVQAVVDDKLLVRDLYVGEPGSRHDSRTFRRSPLYVSLLENQHNQLNPNEHMVGDGAYAVTNFLMVPFPNNGHRTRTERKFNTKLSQCRVRVEHAFGRCKGKWRRLKFFHCYNHRNAMDHITACFVVHNFTVLHGPPLITAEELALPLDDAFANVGHANAMNDDEIVGPEHPLLPNARLQGHEKRQFILHHIIPNLEV